MAIGLAYTLPPVVAAGAAKVASAAAKGGTGGAAAGGGGAVAEGAGLASLAGAASSLKSLNAATSDSFSTMMQTSLPEMKECIQ